MNERLYSPSHLKAVLEKFGFSFKKFYGQNFLIDGNIVKAIVNGAKIGKDDCVLEIGPGVGTMTEEILPLCKKLVAVEIDKKLIEILDYNLKDFDNYKIVNADILKVDLKELLLNEFNGEKVKVIANLPYYISTPIITKLLEEELPISSITVMVQKEVADRMAAKENSKEYGSLSVFVSVYSDLKTVIKVPKTVFMPKPKVDSTVVSMKKKEPLDTDLKLFFTLVKAGFGKRRKNILNSLSSPLTPLDKEVMKEILEKLNIDVNLRAENLLIEDFLKITDEINSVIKKNL